jgi:hypothetical protein
LVLTDCWEKTSPELRNRAKRHFFANVNLPPLISN